MTYKQEITVDRDIFEAIEQGALKLPTLMDTAFKRNVQRLSSRTLVRLRQTPGPVVYPIQWTTPLQRRAFFASDGFGGGIPTRRIGKLQKGWVAKIRGAPEGSIFVIENTATNRDDVRYEQYVTGINQQRFHRNTGWQRSQDILADVLVEAEDVLIETWFTVTDGIINP